MVGLNFTIANFALLLFTSYMAIQTHIFQIRTSIRESLEQLDDLILRNSKIQVILYEFSYYPPSRGTTLKFRFLNLQAKDISGAGNIRNFEKHFEENFELELDEVENIESVNNATIDKTGLLVECNTLSAVGCREIAEEVLIKLQLAWDDMEELPK